MIVDTLNVLKFNIFLVDLHKLFCFLFEASETVNYRSYFFVVSEKSKYGLYL